MTELKTIDLEGVELMSVGGPVHAIGSPPEGDHWTAEHLRGAVEAARELADELKVPAKIGHSSDHPAVGWVENQRLSDDGTKLLGDVRKVPERFAQLLRAGAYRTRSAELSRITSQRSGKVYDWVVTGLAWLGGKQPAIKTLDDVVRLYEGDDAETRAFAIYESESDVDVDAVLDGAVRVGRIRCTEEANWRRMFSIDADLTLELLDQRAPMVFGPGTTMSLAEQHAQVMARTFGVKAEELI